MSYNDIYEERVRYITTRVTKLKLYDEETIWPRNLGTPNNRWAPTFRAVARYNPFRVVYELMEY